MPRRARRTGSEDVLDLVGQIYDAALRPEAWSKVVARVANMWAALHVGAKAIAALSAGAIAFEETIPDRRTWSESASANGFSGPQEVAHVLAGLPVKDSQASADVALHRLRAQGRLQAPELDFRRRLLPHLARCVAIRRYVEDAVAHREAALAVLNRIATGVLFLDRTGRVIHLNRAAQVIVGRRDGLLVTRNELGAIVPGEAQALRRHVRAVVETSKGRGSAAGTVLKLTRGSDRRPLVIELTPLPRGSHGEWGEWAAAAAFVEDPDRAPADALAQRMRVLYGLTAAEARLACLLAGGLSTRDAATRLGVGIETVRSQLKRSLEKTNTHRQAELVALLVRAAP